MFEAEAQRWSAHNTFVEAAGQGLFCCRDQGRPDAEYMHALKCPEAGGRGAFTCMHVRGRGPAEAEAGVTGRGQRPRQAYFVQGLSCRVFT
eukprot:353808-Chlamydomonas_euryale.AAC.3